MSTPTDVPVTGAGTWDDPTWGESGGPFTTPAAVSAGYALNDILPSNDFNYNAQHPARWIRSLRDRMVLGDKGLWTTCVLPNSGTWNTNGGTLDGFHSAPVYVVIDANDDGGVVVEYFVPSGSPHTFTASKDTYININESGAVEYQEVPISDPAPTPTAGYVQIWKIDTDGTELKTETVVSGIGTIPTFRPIAAVSVTTSGDVDVGGSMTVAGDVTLGDNTADTITLTGTVASIRVSGASIFNGNCTLGDAVGDTITVNGTTTFAEDTTFSKDVDIDGNATLGDAAGDSHTVNGSLTMANGDIAIGDNQINGSSLSTVTGGTATFETVDTSDADGIVKVGEVQFYSDASPSSTTGVLQFDGTSLVVGASGAARHVPFHMDSYVAGAISTASAITDTGASVTITVNTGDVLVVEMKSEMTNSSVGTNVTFRLEDNAGVIGSASTRDIVNANRYLDCCKSVRWVAGAAAVQVFKARYGASAGTTSARDILLTVRRAD